MEAADRGRAPATVTAATVLLLVAAAALATDGAIGLAYAVPVTEAFRRAYEGVPGADFSVLSIGFTAGVLLAAAGGLVVLAWFDRRGSRFARFQTWMLGAVLLCWGGSSLVTEPGEPSDVPDPAELERLLDQAMPGWADAATAGTMPVAVGALLPALVLLALPASGRFFRAVTQARLAGDGAPGPGDTDRLV